MVFMYFEIMSILFSGVILKFNKFANNNISYNINKKFVLFKGIDVNYVLILNRNMLIIVSKKYILSV